MGDPLEARLAELVGAEVVALSRDGGGDVAESRRVELSDGRTLFAKTHRDPPDLFFETEAGDLAWLAEPGVVDVAVVVAVEPGLLVLEWIETGRPTGRTDAELGRGLARLHRAGAPCFGREDRRTTGSRALPNEPTSSWSESFARGRLLPLARMASDGGALDPATVGRLEAVAARLDGFGAADEPPARLHGNLWAGNRMVAAGGRSVLIDPAAHGGHREFDLAMMQLFGGYGPDCFGAYDDEHPLADGWRERVPLHQLAPLAVHAVKFGGSYAAATRRALDAVDRIG